MIECPRDMFRAQKLGHSAGISGRIAVQESRAVAGERVAVGLLGQKSKHSQVIAENPDAALGGFDPAGDVGCG